MSGRGQAPESVSAAVVRLDAARRACSADASPATALEYQRARESYIDAVRAEGMAVSDLMDDPLGTGTE
jgi:hypothetical protein